MNVLRLGPLPEGPNRGQLVVPESVATATLTALRQFKGRHWRHEGLVYLAGRTIGEDHLVVAAVVPRCEHNRGSVRAGERAIGDVARTARRFRLGIIAQVHTHPGHDTRHSSGDDHLVLMPFEGMFSIVVADYGRGGITSATGAGVHQYQDRRWVLIPDTYEAVQIVPSALRSDSGD